MSRAVFSMLIALTLVGEALAQSTPDRINSAFTPGSNASGQLDTTFTVYGPRRFERSTGAPVTVTENFTIPSTAYSPYTLSVVNGNADGSSRVSSATVRVNGVLVVRQNDLNQQVASLVRPVNLTTQNTIEVRLTSQPRSFLIIRIMATDRTAPRLTVTTPPDNFITNASSVAVTGTVLDETRVALTINGNSVPVESDGAFSGEIPIVEGPNTITIVATDTVGNSTTVTRLVIRDTTPPLLTVSQPTDSLITSQASIDVQGSVSDSTAVVLRVNGRSVPVEADGSWATQDTLVEGWNTITVEAVDAAGNVSRETRDVRRETLPPVLTITSPMEGAIVDSDSILVSGRITSTSTVTLTINGDAVPVESDGAFSTQLSVVEGRNQFLLIAADALGQQDTLEVSVVRDTTPPVLTLSFPPDSMITHQSSIVVSGTVVDSTTVTVAVNGITFPVEAGGTFSGSVALVEGWNAITIVATDAAGNERSETRNVRRDTQLPIVDWRLPIDGFITDQSSVEVSGTVLDSTAVTLTVNGVAVEVQTGGSFSTIIELIEGVNQITVVATDAAGNRSTSSRRIVRETGVILPPDPATVAPALDLTVATTMHAATEFLYTGANPIQTGVTPGTIEPVRAAVVRGKVLTRENEPLLGVAITILNHPEFGSTLSRADGMFDMAVNGGGYLTVNYAKQGYLGAQRQVNVPWQDYTVVDSVILVQLDTAVTTIDFSEPVQVARGSVTMDERGERRATLLFKQGTQATMVLANGDTVALPSLSVRATEYTVGPNGPTAMPAELPKTVFYTYCVELSADEAIAAGAEEVRFDKGVAFYVENFLSLPVNASVPVGIYDRRKGQWIPQPDGRIIRVLSIDGGIAQVDLDGDNVAEDPDTLAAAGMPLEEQTKLASLYTPGQTLWRAEVQRFSPCDMNYVALLYGLRAPRQEDPFKNDPKIDKTCNTGGSIIKIQKQALAELIPITGTPLNLYYESEQASNRNAITISLTDNTTLVDSTNVFGTPVTFPEIRAIVYVAGRNFIERFKPQKNLKYTFAWDGKDVYGRRLQGAQPIRIQVQYWFFFWYYWTWEYILYRSTFGSHPTSPRDSCHVWWPVVGEYTQEFRGRIGGWNAMPKEDVGGWSLSNHHKLDVAAKTLLLGNGETRSARVMANSLTPILRSYWYKWEEDGGGASSIQEVGNNAPQVELSYVRPRLRSIEESRKNVQASEIPDSIRAPMSVAVGADGSLYFAEKECNVVTCLKPNGSMVRIAGTGEAGFSGDGGPATEAQLNSPRSIALSSDGSIYIADTDNYRVRHVSPDGIITTVAGNGGNGSVGDGGPATEAQIGYPVSIAVGRDGSLFIADPWNRRIRRVSPGGYIETVAGSGQVDFDAEGVAVGPDWSVYFSDTWSSRVLRIRVDGTIEIVAGTGQWGYSGDGGMASSAKIGRPGSIAVDAVGALYIADWSYNVIRRVTTDGIITTVAGASGSDYQLAYGPATRSALVSPGSVAVGADGNLYIIDYNERRVTKTAPVFPGFTDHEQAIASEDGSEYYVFDRFGKHLRTLDALTGAKRFEFTYDVAGRLIGVRDIDSLLTTIERDASGSATAIVSPFGQRTTFTLNPNGYLASVTNPANETVQFTYTDYGLMTGMADAKENAHHFTYGAYDRLIRDDDAAGGFKALTRTNLDYGYEVAVTTAEGRKSSYKVERMPEGGLKMTNTNEAGLATVSIERENGTIETTSPDGTVTRVVSNPDPRFGMQAPLSTVTVTTPGGLTSTVAQSKVISQVTGLQVTGMTERTVINGRTYTSILEGWKAPVGA